ncbi:MAG: tetratricopeptide repeat protein [Hyphomicrobiaceae bacterium]
MFDIARPARTRVAPRLGLVAAVTAGLLLSACASTSRNPGFLAEQDSAQPAALGKLPADASPEAAKAYWATAYSRNPKDETAALRFAQALKATGEKDHAESLLQQAAMYNPDSKPIASELGRMALEKDNYDLAAKLLARADDPTNPDWRVVSAIGTIHAKQGQPKEAQGYFERAYELAPAEPAVLNNLALSYALNGDPAKAEQLLRKAADAGGDTAKIRQNLALVLGVQGRFKEAEKVAETDLAAGKAQANVAYLEKMVKATPIQLGKTETTHVAVAAPAASEPAPAGDWAAETASEPAPKVASAATN